MRTGVSEIYKYNEGFHVIDIKHILPKQIKTFKEAKGEVMSGYQNEIESNWIQELRNRYDIKVERSVFNKIKNRLKSN